MSRGRMHALDIALESIPILGTICQEDCKSNHNFFRLSAQFELTLIDHRYAFLNSYVEAYRRSVYDGQRLNSQIVNTLFNKIRHISGVKNILGGHDQQAMHHAKVWCENATFPNNSSTPALILKSGWIDEVGNILIISSKWNRDLMIHATGVP